jgi:hypothetical protein
MKITLLGESHHGKHLDQIKNILSNPPKLDKIFLELPISHQPSINHYLNNSEVDTTLDKTFSNTLKEGNNIKDTILFILDLAKEKNISVLCIDSSKIKTQKYNKVSPHGKWFLKGESRDEDMFNAFIENYKKNENVAVICGANHLSEGLHFRTGLETFGTKMKNKFLNNLKIIILK